MGLVVLTFDFAIYSFFLQANNILSLLSALCGCNHVLGILIIMDNNACCYTDGVHSLFLRRSLSSFGHREQQTTCCVAACKVFGWKYPSGCKCGR